MFPAEHDQLRARKQPVHGKSVSAAIGAGVRDLPCLRRPREEDPEPALSRTARGVQVLGDAGNGQLRLPEGAGVCGRLMAAIPPAPPRVLASTTSHKREPLLPTLEVFSRLGLRDVDLNLHHILEAGVAVEAVQKAAIAGGLRIWIVSGGWGDFFDSAPTSDETDRSVARQVDIATRLGAGQIRLFFGRLKFEDYTVSKFDTIAANLMRL